MAYFSFIRQSTKWRKLVGLIILLAIIYLFCSPNTLFSFARKTLSLPPANTTKLTDGLEHPYPAPPIDGITTWLNSPPLTLEALRGKVVLVDFWTYSCINCLRTLPYLKQWYAKYHDQGFVLIGVHSPEFEFEQDVANVKRAIKDNKIFYPIALDDHFVTWQNYKNQFWPAHYLINKEGKVVYQHFGEGNYEETENNIRFLLGMPKTDETVSSVEQGSATQTPETYLGFERAANFASREAVVKNSMAIYSYPKSLRKNKWALQGKWIVANDKVIAGSPGASLRLHFSAKKVYAVMGTPGGENIKVVLLLNGKPLVAERGKDVEADKNRVTVDRHRLYTLVNTETENEGELELYTSEPGLEIYTFTFGD